MFATIVFGIVIIISAIVFIWSCIDGETDICAWCIGFFLGSLLSITISLWAGYSFKPNLEEKHHIETLLEVQPDLYVIEKAQEYNEDVNEFNNLWYRFTIEDRSEYLIDIDYYVNGR